MKSVRELVRASKARNCNNSLQKKLEYDYGIWVKANEVIDMKPVNFNFLVIDKIKQ